MKKLIFLILVLTSHSVNAGLWEKVTTLGNKEVKVTGQYNVPAPGWDLRVVEWAPKENKNVRCLFAGGSKKGGVACYPVKGK